MPPSKLTVFSLYNYLQVKNKTNLQSFHDSSQLKVNVGFKLQARRREGECLRKNKGSESREGLNKKSEMRMRRRGCVVELSVSFCRCYKGLAGKHL